jgi:hypothetical protein
VSVSYRIYANDAAGGPIDWTTPIGTTTGLTFQPPPLALNSDNLFGLRAFDPVTGFEDQSVDAVVRVVIDGAGNDVTRRPAAPVGLTAFALGNGGARVTWTVNRALLPGREPTQFKVWLTAGTTVNYAAAPAATVSYGSPIAAAGVWFADLIGLANGTQYAIGVRASNAFGDDPNTVAALVTGSTTAGVPTAVDGATISAPPST